MFCLARPNNHKPDRRCWHITRHYLTFLTSIYIHWSFRNVSWNSCIEFNSCRKDTPKEQSWTYLVGFEYHRSLVTELLIKRCCKALKIKNASSTVSFILYREASCKYYWKPYQLGHDANARNSVWECGSKTISFWQTSRCLDTCPSNLHRSWFVL